MADLKGQIRSVELEIEKTEQRRVAIFKRITAATSRVQALVDFADKELQKAKQEPNPTKRERLVYLNELRRQGALVNLEMLQTLTAADLTKPLQLSMVNQIDQLCVRSQYIVMEYNLASYKRVVKAIEAVLGEGSAPAAPADAKPGVTPSKTGPLGAARPGLPGPGARPPLPGRTGPLAGPLAPRAPLGQQAARPGVPGAPGRTPLQARPSTSGPLAAAGNGTGRLVGTGKLSASAAQAEAQLQEDVKQALADDAGRTKLRMLLDRVAELEAALAPLRGDGVGQLAISMAEAEAPIRQIAGKVYYINRAVTALGPVGAKIPFESNEGDPAVLEMLAQIAPDANPAPPAPAAGAAGDQPVSLANRLKSLFKS